MGSILKKVKYRDWGGPCGPGQFTNITQSVVVKIFRTPEMNVISHLQESIFPIRRIKVGVYETVSFPICMGMDLSEVF